MLLLRTRDRVFIRRSLQMLYTNLVHVSYYLLIFIWYLEYLVVIQEAEIPYADIARDAEVGIHSVSLFI